MTVNETEPTAQLRVRDSMSSVEKGAKLHRKLYRKSTECHQALVTSLVRS